MRVALNHLRADHQLQRHIKTGSEISRVLQPVHSDSSIFVTWRLPQGTPNVGFQSHPNCPGLRIEAVPRNPGSQSQELVAAARSVLGQTEHEGYILTIRKMEGCMKTLSSHLDLDRQMSLKPAREDDKPTCFNISLKTPCRPSCWHQVEFQTMKKRKVTFKHPPPNQDSDPLSMDNLKVIDNLCGIFCRQATPMPCAGLGLDPQGRIRGMYQAANDAVSFSDHLITLVELLFPSSKGPRRKPLINYERYLLAITLASSCLQLHTTPWLAKCWSKAYVLFPETKRDNLFMADVRYPLVVKDVNLLTLGKLLLEIRLNDRVQQSSEDLGEDGQPNEATEIQMLGRWIRQEEENLSHAWLDAVTCCMKCSTDPFPKLQDPEYRQTMLNGIVVPLFEELHILQKGVS
ncbi:hypothetical protein ACJZ2D_012954 [Fusarium nematophilum]